MKIMPIYNLSQTSKHTKQNQLSQEEETNKTQINSELIEGKTRFQTRKQKRKRNRGFPPGRKPSQKSLIDVRVFEGGR